MKIAPEFFDGIRQLIAGAQATVARGVNLVQVHTNLEIGRRIVEEELRGQDRAAYGEEVIRALAARLTGEFGKGFSFSNLKSMRLFYLQNEHRIGQTVSGQFSLTPIGQSVTDEFGLIQTPTGESAPPPRPFTLSWSHYVFLLRVKNPDERSFYEIEASEQNWTLRELRRQFDAGLYERLALSRDKEGIRRLAQEGQTVAQPRDLLKEPLILEFLGWRSAPAIPSPISNPPSSARSSVSSSNWAKASSSRRARSASPSTKITSSWTWFSTTASCAAMSCST